MCFYAFMFFCFFNCMTYHSGNQLIDPQIVFQKSHLQPGMRVADFGCGKTGHLVFPAAVIVGEQGIVYAVDIIKELLAEIDKRAALEAFHNVRTVWADVERVGSSAIPEESLDLVFLMNILARAPEREHILEEAARLLKDKARLVIVDWARGGLPISPTASQLVSFPIIEKWGLARGFVVQSEFSPGPYHHGIVLYRHS